MPYLNIDVPGDAAATLIPALAGYRLKVLRLLFTASLPTVVQFASGATVISGPIELLDSGAVVLDKTFFITAAGEAFNIAQTGGANLGGRLFFDYIPESRQVVETHE